MMTSTQHRQSYSHGPGLIAFIILCTGLLLSGCSQKTTQVSDSQPQQAVEKVDELEQVTQQYQQAMRAMSDNDWNRAQSLLTQIMREYPDFSGPYANLALINFKQEKFDESLQQVNKAIELNESQSQAYHLRAQLMLKAGNIMQARDDYMRAIELQPDYLNAHYNLALLYDIYLQDIAQAITHYERYLTLLKHPDNTTRDWIDYLKSTLNNG